MNVDMLTGILLNKLQAFFYVTEATLTEDIEFINAYIFSSKHIHLDTVKTLRW